MIRRRQRRHRKPIRESSISRILRHGETHDCGCITAFKGYRTPQDNMVKNRELYIKLKEHGYGITSVVGHYQEQKDGIFLQPSTEQSFYVVDLNDDGDLKQTLVELGRMYDQDSIYFKPAGPGKGMLISSMEHNKGRETDRAKESYYGAPKQFDGNDFRAWTDIRNRSFADNIDASPIYESTYRAGYMRGLRAAKRILRDAMRGK